jgi:hypothetical protein
VFLVDIGGQWIGPHEKVVMALTDELKIERITQKWPVRNGTVQKAGGANCCRLFVACFRKLFWLVAFHPSGPPIMCQVIGAPLLDENEVKEFEDVMAVVICCPLECF